MDKLNAMAVFVRVVESGSFSAVARELGTSQPTISKQVQALETSLGGRLIARSTRQLSLTDEGQRYFEQCRQILSAVDNAELSFQTGREQVAGPLRVASSVSFGRTCIAPVLGEFLACYPQVSLDLQLSDRNEDLVSEGIDVSLRIGELPASGMIARRLGHMRRLVLAAPAYLAGRGTPQSPEALREHNCLVFNLLPDAGTWTFIRDGHTQSVRVSGNARSNSSEAIREMVLSGLGISLSPDWLFMADLAAGRVVALLQDFTPSTLPIHALSPANRRQSARVRTFVDFIAQKLA
ncbi:LysR family transcriptional regulator [Pseudomonas resinovorans]|uniref:LysR family transcriptional regulator n=1 Tax=Metapseudomonas resinovorans TaxID=53412 RepID=UPI00237EF072|nr:LysR family transcriptional regulator [Pseudomonas resinovorans]MDE3735302.1 LysR family transcriptional regulator [Pseudomonas resinovorans]